MLHLESGSLISAAPSDMISHTVPVPETQKYLSQDAVLQRTLRPLGERLHSQTWPQETLDMVASGPSNAVQWSSNHNQNIAPSE